MRRKIAIHLLIFTICLWLISGCAPHLKNIESKLEYGSVYYIRYSDKQCKEYLESLNNAVRENPTDGTLYNKLGNLYYRCGKRISPDYVNKAIENYTKAIAINPNSDVAYYNRSKAYKFKGINNLALEDINKAISLNQDPDYYATRAEIYHLAIVNEDDKAIEDYTKAISLKSSAEYYKERGSIYYIYKRQYDKAIEDYTKVISLEKLSSISDYYYYVRAKSYQEIGQYDKALEDLKKACEISKKDQGPFKIKNIYDSCKDLSDMEERLKDNIPPLITIEQPDIGSKRVKEQIVKTFPKQTTTYPPKPLKEAPVEYIHEIPDFKSTPRNNDLAVVIGIENYQGLPKSDYSKSDAGIVKDYLKALGFAERNIELIADERATKSSIEKSIEAWLPNRVKKDSRIIIYYSGHGAPEPKTGDAYIVPFDGDPNYLEITGYPLKRLYDKLGKLEAHEVIVLLDSCFSGAGGRSVLAKGARPLVMMAEGLVLSQNMAVLSATQGTQISSSSPEKGHGIFTYYFLKALKGGKKNIAEIYEYIKPLVEDEAKQLNVQQSPSLNPDVEKIKGRFGLRK